MNSPSNESSVGDAPDYVGRHLKLGWWTLLCFLSLGMVLEAMHGLKVGWYLDVGNDARRLVWTLAHAHGVLLALVNIAFALTLAQIGERTANWVRRASASLIGATIALPGGFFLGGIIIYSGDPGLGILLVPVGAVLLFFSVYLTARGVGMLSREGTEVGK